MSHFHEVLIDPLSSGTSKDLFSPPPPSQLISMYRITCRQRATRVLTSSTEPVRHLFSSKLALVDDRTSSGGRVDANSLFRAKRRSLPRNIPLHIELCAAD